MTYTSSSPSLLLSSVCASFKPSQAACLPACLLASLLAAFSAWACVSKLRVRAGRAEEKSALAYVSVLPQPACQPPPCLYSQACLMPKSYIYYLTCLGEGELGERERELQVDEFSN